MKYITDIKFTPKIQSLHVDGGNILDKKNRVGEKITAPIIVRAERKGQSDVVLSMETTAGPVLVVADRPQKPDTEHPIEEHKFQFTLIQNDYARGGVINPAPMRDVSEVPPPGSASVFLVDGIPSGSKIQVMKTAAEQISAIAGSIQDFQFTVTSHAYNGIMIVGRAVHHDPSKREVTAQIRYTIVPSSSK